MAAILILLGIFLLLKVISKNLHRKRQMKRKNSMFNKQRFRK